MWVWPAMKDAQEAALNVYGSKKNNKKNSSGRTHKTLVENFEVMFFHSAPTWI